MKRRQYGNPPIQEAVCEFRLKSGAPWNLTIPGKLQLALQESGADYAGNPRQQTEFEVNFETHPGAAPHLRYREGPGKTQLLTTDGRRMVSVGPDVVSVHLLHPYQDPRLGVDAGWPEFAERIRSALDAYWRVASPEGVLRVGVRYINRLPGAVSLDDMHRFLRSAPPSVNALPDRMTAVMSRIEYRYGDGAHLVLSQGTAPGHDPILLLDLDVFRESEAPMSASEALTWAKKLREREREAFEALITDDARSLFDADEPN